jgi:hypothetical protein
MSRDGRDTESWHGGGIRVGWERNENGLERNKDGDGDGRGTRYSEKAVGNDVVRGGYGT